MAKAAHVNSLPPEFENIVSSTIKKYVAKHESKLRRMHRMEYTNDLLNQFKLILYDGNVNDATQFYHSDKFCHLHCIDGTSATYGCKLKISMMKTAHLNIQVFSVCTT